MKLKFFLIILIFLPMAFFVIKQWPSFSATPAPSVQQALKLYSLDQNNTLIPPKTSFKAQEPVSFVLTFEKSASFLPFVKTALAQGVSLDKWTDETQTIKTGVFYDRDTEPTKNIAVEIKPLEESKFSFALQNKYSGRLQPGKYRLKVTREAGGQTQTLTQDFSWGVLALNPSKSIYLPEEIAKLGIGVLNNQGRTICNATVSLQVTDPEGIVTTLSETNRFLRKSGQCQETSVTNVPDYLAGYKVGKPGIYKLHLEANNGNGVKSMDDSFEVRESVPFDIERSDYPMRIYPPAQYQAKITVKANQDFKGVVEESVPASFDIKQSTAYSLQTTAQEKKITWNVDWKKGEKYELSYSIKFPPISPEFYLVGPLAFSTSEESPSTSLETSRPTSEVFRESRQWQIASDAITTLFMESGTDATQDGKFYSTFPSTASSDTTVAKTGPRSVKCDSGAGNSDCQVRYNGSLADAGRRLGVYFNLTNLPGTGTRIIDFKNSSGTTSFSLNIATNGQVRLLTSGINCGNGSMISTGTWYRLSVAYVITSTTNFSIKVFLNGNQDIAATQSNCTLNTNNTADLFIGWASQPGANSVVNFDDVYLDNGTDLTDPGDIRVTSKLPNTVNNNNFDTTGGTGAVNERPISETNYMQDATSSTPGATQDYTLQTAATGDVDISSAKVVTLVARTAWVWAMSGMGTVSTNASIIDNSSETAITLTTSSALYTVTTDSSSYPSNAAGIGMRAIDGTADTYFYEGGTLIAYKPVTNTQLQGIQIQGLQIK